MDRPPRTRRALGGTRSAATADHADPVSAFHSDSRLRAQYVPSSWMAPQEERSAAAEALVAAAMELARRSLRLGRLTAELADEPPARALLDRAADAELLVLGTTLLVLRAGTAAAGHGAGGARLPAARTPPRRGRLSR